MELDVAGAGMEVDLPLVAEGEDEMINQVRTFQLLSHPGSTPLTLVATPCASQENSWQVISSFFEAKGLVRQQLVRPPAFALPNHASPWVRDAHRLVAWLATGLVRRVYPEHDAGDCRYAGCQPCVGPACP